MKNQCLYQQADYQPLMFDFSRKEIKQSKKKKNLCFKDFFESKLFFTLPDSYYEHFSAAIFSSSSYHCAPNFRISASLTNLYIGIWSSLPKLHASSQICHLW